MKDLFDSDLSSSAVARLILAGARSVALATQVIAFIDDFKRQQPEVGPYLETLCRNVIKDWGLDMAIPAAAAPTEEPVLVWPPREPTLPDVFMENFYSVRAPVTGQALFPDDNVIELQPDVRLRFTGKAHWSAADRCWMFRVTATSHADLTTWVRHTVLKPGDEIPKEQR